MTRIGLMNTDKNRFDPSSPYRLEAIALAWTQEWRARM